MPRLALYLLGPPRVYLRGAAVEIKRRKVLALLAYLVDHRAAPGPGRAVREVPPGAGAGVGGEARKEDGAPARPDPLRARDGEVSSPGVFLFALEGEEGEPGQALREAIGAAGGRLLATAGRALCAAFTAAREAVLAGSGCRARAVLLAGEGTPRAEDPSPALMQRAELLLEAAHPGQVLLDDAAAELAASAGLPVGLGLRCLGDFRLNDLGAARPIHQLLCPGRQQDFPVLRTLDSRPNNLPTQPTPFIGREEELAGGAGSPADRKIPAC